MSRDDDYARRPHDHLVEPMFDALPDAAPSGRERGVRWWLLGAAAVAGILWLLVA